MKVIENGLIPVYERENVKLVNARELHVFLEVSSKFADWIKNRIEKYEFVEGQDYITISKNLENGGRSIEYVFKLEPAKEIAMVENNEKGKQIRRYFINVEEKYRKQVEQFQVPQTFADALRLAAEQWESNQKLLTAIEEQKPKVIFAEALQISENTILIGELAKMLKQNGINVGQNRLFDQLRNDGYLGTKGEYYNLPTQKSMELKLFEIKTSTVNNPDGSVRVTKTTKVTGKGQVYFVNKFLSKIPA